MTDNQIRLKRIFIEAKLPQELQPLRDLAYNLWWSWNQEAIRLFRSIDESSWEASNYNPVLILDNLNSEKANQLKSDQAFMDSLARVYQQFQSYMAEKPKQDAARIAYFSMEYGLHISLRLYSGGLGVLAGDFLKEASDSNVDMIGVGLLYRYGYFQQGISMHGDQINNYPPQHFTRLPLQPVRNVEGDWLKISLHIQDRVVFAKVWELKIGRISLYLLDTDLDENSPEDSSLTYHLYGGDNEHRLKQEILLGIGGVRMLQAIDKKFDIYHCNEGHAAFMGLERLKNFIQKDGLTYPEAVEVVRSSSLFTTHTPVPAGHDYFPEHLLRNYLYNYIADLGIDWGQFIALGRINPNNGEEQFSMSHLAIRLSQEVNGVSKLHGEVSQKMFDVLYKGFHSDELHIGYVTNSIHYPTWIANEWHELYLNTFGHEFYTDQSNKDYWRKIHEVPAETIFSVRKTLKERLLDYVKIKIKSDLTRRGENPRTIFSVLNGINKEALVIGFARRFATYKRANLLFSNLDRLRAMFNNSDRPIMFLFAGKAHPADRGGQDLIKNIVELSKNPEFAGKIIFLENYNMELAKLLVQGVDIWLNTPTRPKEASGTSGMKAVMNGVINFSVLDGWWAEGYRPDAGWALPLERTYDEQYLQNELDAESIYNILENEIVPTYFDHNEEGISESWIGYIKQTIAEVAPVYTMKRMMDDYFDRFYNKLCVRSREIHQNNFVMASKLAQWKAEFQRKWPYIEITNSKMLDTDNHSLPLGENFEAEIELDLHGLPAENIGLDVLFFRRNAEKGTMHLKLKKAFVLKEENGQKAIFGCTFDPHLSGVYEYGFRLYPKHDWLAHQQDFNLVHWF